MEGITRVEQLPDGRWAVVREEMDGTRRLVQITESADQASETAKKQIDQPSGRFPFIQM